VSNSIKQSKCEIISEIGLSHEGSLGFALKFIEASKKSGADMVKFQYHIPDQESSNKEDFRINFSLQDNSRWGYWERTSFNIKEWKIIIDECNAQDITFCTSVFSKKAAKIMIDFGVKNLKLGSGDFFNEELLEFFLKWDGNLYLSTGLATTKEIESTIFFFKESTLSNLTIFQCTSKYPTPYNQVGIDIMLEIKHKFDVHVGLSDHSKGIDSALVAICNGASAIEKHVTFSENLFGPDVTASITFEELARLSKFRDNYVEIIKEVNKDQITSELQKEKKLFGRSLGVTRSCKSGEILKESDFCLRKPAGGLSWGDRSQLVGKRVKKDIEIDELLNLEDFEL
jgi:N,N'-diacetyllegionaminate synthase